MTEATAASRYFVEVSALLHIMYWNIMVYKSGRPRYSIITRYKLVREAIS